MNNNIQRDRHGRELKVTKIDKPVEQLPNLLLTEKIIRPESYELTIWQKIVQWWFNLSK